MNVKINTKIAILCFVITLQLNISAQELRKTNPEKVGISSDRLNYLTQTMEAYVKSEQLSGLVTLVARRGEIAYLEAFGMSDIENKRQMQENTIFRIASQTKAIVSVGAMILQEEGKLLISDPVGKYIPAFKETTVEVAGEDGTYEIVKADRPITIRDLLTHTAGIGYGYGLSKDLWNKAKIQGWYFANREEPIQETVNRIASLPFESQPGEKFVYGYSTDILGAVIEIVSGNPLDDFIQDHILSPLGMNDTHFYLPESKHDRLAVVYAPEEKGLQRSPDLSGMKGQGAYVSGPKKSFSGGAGLLSTARDYAIFLQMMLNEGSYQGVRIISPKTVELMTVNHLDKISFPWSAGTGFGLGFATTEDFGARGTMGSNGEYGWGGAYHSTYWVDPQEELLVVYFTQLLPAPNIDDHAKLRALIYQALVD